MDQIRGSLSESWAVTSRQSLTKPDVHTLPCLATETNCGPVIVCCPDEIQPFPSQLHKHTLFVCLRMCVHMYMSWFFFFHLLYTLLYFYAAICAACKHTQTPDLMLLCSLWCFVTFIIRSWRKALHLSLLFANDNLKLELELESDFIRFECEHK